MDCVNVPKKVDLWQGCPNWFLRQCCNKTCKMYVQYPDSVCSTGASEKIVGLTNKPKADYWYGINMKQDKIQKKIINMLWFRVPIPNLKLKRHIPNQGSHTREANSLKSTYVHTVHIHSRWRLSDNLYLSMIVRW